MKTACFTCMVLLMLFSIGNSEDRYVPDGIALHISVAQMGMGGVTATAGDNAHTLFYNPALLARQRTALEIAPASGGFNKNAPRVFRFINDHTYEFENFTDLTADRQIAFMREVQKFNENWVGVQATPYLGYIRNNFGVGAYSVSQADVRIDHGVFVPAIGLRSYMDIVLGAGYGKPVAVAGNALDLGVTARLVQRRLIEPRYINASQARNFRDILRTSVDELKDAQNGFGIDLGGIYHAMPSLLPGHSRLNLGLTVRDAIASLGGYISPTVNTGAMLNIPSRDPNLLQYWSAGLDFNDIFNRQGVSFFQRVNAGTEFSLFSGVIKLRGGVHQGYPTGGAGLKVYVFQLDYAYFTRELGAKPGQFSESAHKIQLVFVNK